jgi:hypothetical protein
MADIIQADERNQRSQKRDVIPGFWHGMTPNWDIGEPYGRSDQTDPFVGKTTTFVPTGTRR